MRAVVGRMPLWMDEGCDVETVSDKFAETAMLTDRDWAEYRAKGLKAHGQKGLKGAQGLKVDGAEDRRGSGAEGMMSDGAEGEEPRA